jgi:ubiquinone/menaquinone biosynthesis C-methylase UbiE
MNVKEAYNNWAAQYDTNLNKTRDLEARSLRSMLADMAFDSCLEIGCGTGKNTIWLIEKAKQVTAVDLSEEMLAKAGQKIDSPKVNFIQADITKPWHFISSPYDLVTFSLVLEHIENLGDVFEKTAAALRSGGHLYIGELHPFKQYTGSKARFETEQGVQVVTCYNHHVSEFVQSARQHGLMIVDINEFFDEDQREIPRILSLIMKKV